MKMEVYAIVMDKNIEINMEKSIANLGAVVIAGPNNVIKGYHKLFMFCNGYGLSVRRSLSNYVSPLKMDYEVAQIKHGYSENTGEEDYGLCYSGSFKDDVVGYAEPEKVIELAKEVKRHRRRKNEVYKQ